MYLTYKILPPNLYFSTVVTGALNHLNPAIKTNSFVAIRKSGISMYPKRGALIVLEGADRSGKSTQSKMLVESLKKQNIEAELMVFPDRTTTIGKMIAQYLSNSDCKLHDKAIHMLFSANRWESYEKIITKLRSGISLIVDRYSYSGIAYSASKLGMDIEWCKTQEIGLPKPDLVCLLTVNEEELSSRPGFGNERYENKEMQRKVLAIYKELADSSWEFVDASGTVENVHNTLLNKILKVVNNIGKEIEPLHFKKDCLKENINCNN